MIEPQPIPAADEFALAAATVQELERTVHAALIGQAEIVHEVIVAMLAGGHVLIEGLPGLGKTLLARAVAKAIGGRFSRIQFTPDLMPADVTGHAMFDTQSETFRIRRGPVFCNLLLGDEINRAPAKTQAALLEAMQEAQVTIEGRSYVLAPPFLVLATQNPIEQEGTYPLPQAQLDRFLLNALIDYPTEADERELVRCVTRGQIADQLDLSRVKEVMDSAQVSALQRQVANIGVDDAVLDYAVRLVRATRDRHGIAAGAGPRASIALLRAARGEALFGGRRYVIPADIKRVAPPVLRHRVKLTPDLEIEGIRPDAVLTELLDQIEAPRL